MAKEARARIKINKLLENAAWRFFDDENICLAFAGTPALSGVEGAMHYLAPRFTSDSVSPRHCRWSRAYADLDAKKRNAFLRCENG